MTNKDSRRTPGTVSRRSLLTAGGTMTAVAATARLWPAATTRPVAPPAPVAATSSTRTAVYRHLVATDGWVSMPATAPANPPYFPDPAAPPQQDTYVFGFRNATSVDPPVSATGIPLGPALPASTLAPFKGHAQINAPLLDFDETDDIFMTLTNLGLQQRPDLVDGHTIHWHGFQNAIPLFDGVPELSMSVPIGRSFQYFYRPHQAGTYMYHCHFEDVEHVQMGMTGMVYVRPTGWTPTTRFAYHNQDGSPATETSYDREFAVFLTELWSEAHYRDAHIQATDWTDYTPSFWLMNGRAYPDTLAPGGWDPTTGTPSDERLRYQPISSLIRCNPGDRVLLRIASLGYQAHAMTIDGIPLTMVAKDSNLLVGRDGTKNFRASSSVEIGPGESRDVVFTAPSTPGTYLLYARDYGGASNGGGRGLGGQMTEIRVGLTSTPLPPQTGINA